MFENPGNKIKKITTVLCIIALVCIAIASIVCLVAANILAALLILLIGGFSTYFSHLLLYAYGELVENSAM